MTLLTYDMWKKQKDEATAPQGENRKRIEAAYVESVTLFCDLSALWPIVEGVDNGGLTKSLVDILKAQENHTETLFAILKDTQ
jgi:hypothetical protein